MGNKLANEEIEINDDLYKNRFKICSLCKRELTLDSFHKNKNNKDGLAVMCRECKSQKDKEYYLKNKDKLLQYQKDYREENLEKVKDRVKKYYEDNKDAILDYAKQYRDEHSEQISHYMAEYKDLHRDKISQYKKEYRKLHKEDIKKWTNSPSGKASAHKSRVKRRKRTSSDNGEFSKKMTL